LKVRVRVHAGSGTPKTELRGDALHIWVRELPVDGKANLAVIETLASSYKVPKRSVRLASGHTSKTKLFEIDGL
jgi:uncharacterized protein